MLAIWSNSGESLRCYDVSALDALTRCTQRSQSRGAKGRCALTRQPIEIYRHRVLEVRVEQVLSHDRRCPAGPGLR